MFCSVYISLKLEMLSEIACFHQQIMCDIQIPVVPLLHVNPVNVSNNVNNGVAFVVVKIVVINTTLY